MNSSIQKRTRATNLHKRHMPIRRPMQKKQTLNKNQTNSRSIRLNQIWILKHHQNNSSSPHLIIPKIKRSFNRISMITAMSKLTNQDNYNRQSKFTIIPKKLWCQQILLLYSNKRQMPKNNPNPKSISSNSKYKIT